MNVNLPVFGKRLRYLRKKYGVTQKRMANILSEISRTKKVISISAISCWERGERNPSEKVVRGIAEFFDVSIDYISGWSDEQKEFDAKEVLDPNCIRKNHLRLYDKKPVYVVFPDSVTESRWGIYDGNKDRIVFLDGEATDVSISDLVIYKCKC